MIMYDILYASMNHMIPTKRMYIGRSLNYFEKSMNEPFPNSLWMEFMTTLSTWSHSIILESMFSEVYLGSVKQSIQRMTSKWSSGSTIKSTSMIWCCTWRGQFPSSWLVLSSSPDGVVIRYGVLVLQGDSGSLVMRVHDINQCVDPESTRA